MSGFRALIATLFALSIVAHAAPAIQAAPVPAEMLSSFFAVTVNNQRVDVAHAASNYDFVTFDTTGPVDISITAAEPGFWDRGVDIEPWRLGLRAQRRGPTISIHLTEPAKLSISRPGDYLNQARMLFVFAGTPPPKPPVGPNVAIVRAGVHRQSLNPKSGETIYLAPGAYIFGSLNLWQVNGVKVLGRGTIVYDGPQDPTADEGWMQKPDWHCVGAYQAHNIEIDGLTCIVRSRTWSIQMKDSTRFTYDDLRVIGGNTGNANQDGIDWLGGGDTVIRNAFLRASDDDLAAQGNWDGYTDADMLRSGADVNNILVENSELSTSISNIVRIGWPQKIFNSKNFTLRDSDILHAGIGACGQTFGLLGFWGANGASGSHSAITLQNLLLDNWYSLAQIEQEQPGLEGITFRNIWALDQPPLADSNITGDVKGVTFDNVKYGQMLVTDGAQVPLAVSSGTERPRFVAEPQFSAGFRASPLVFAPKQTLTLTAKAVQGARYTWLFGDGTAAHGRQVHHRFPDAEGTALDGKNGAGRFRVLLHITDTAGHQDWAAQDLVAIAQWHGALKHMGPTIDGLTWKVYAGGWTELPDMTSMQPVLSGESSSLEANAEGFTRYATAWDGFIDIPVDGGYIFRVIDRDGARLMIDGVEIARTGPPFAQVCGSPGNALRYDVGAIGLRSGLHNFHLESLNSESAGAPRLLWEGPGIQLSDVPQSAFKQHKGNEAGSSAGSEDDRRGNQR